jgi:hypothetical protein
MDKAFLESKATGFSPFEEQWMNGDSAAREFSSLDRLFATHNRGRGLMGELNGRQAI